MWSGVCNQVCLVILNLRQIVLSTGAGRRHASYFSCHCEMPGGDNSREERERETYFGSQLLGTRSTMAEVIWWLEGFCPLGGEEGVAPT